MVGNQRTRLLFDKDLEALLTTYPVLDTFETAADSFVKHVDNTVSIWAANRDWFLEPWGRDTFIALPGILLTPGRYGEAKSVFRHFARYEQGGLIPNRIRPNLVEYNTADASMWFIQALKSYLNHTGDWAFVQELLQVISNIIESYIIGTSYERFGKRETISMDGHDGLIVTPPQATWMDADPLGNRPITPRYGKTVEINALWYSNLSFLAKVEEHLDVPSRESNDYASLAARVKVAFNDKFWNRDEHALYDVIEGDLHGGAIRPNMVFAVSHGGDLLPPHRQLGVVNSAQNDLLTPGGLRSLSPRDSNYIGEYDTYLPPEEKDLAYHQGTSWPWLMGPYSDALARVRCVEGKNENAIRGEIARNIAPLVRFCLESPYGSLPEVFSGNPPYEPGGTSSQAWSVAEVLRVLVEYKLVSGERRGKADK
jgi:predicted glycogen debranching enzyme